MSELRKQAILRQFEKFPQLLICLDICSRGGSVIFGENPPDLSLEILAQLRAEGKIKREFVNAHGIQWCVVTLNKEARS